MAYRYNAKGLKPDQGYPIITKPGWYPFRIEIATEGESKSGNYMVTVDCVCLDPQWKDYMIRHWVTFMKPEEKGAGMALHFLRAIGQPHEGEFDINPMAWERKTFMGNVIIAEHQGKQNNKFKAVSPIKQDSNSEENPFQ